MTPSHADLVELAHACLRAWRNQKPPFDVMEVELLLFCFHRFRDHQDAVENEARAIIHAMLLAGESHFDAELCERAYALLRP